MVVCRSGIHRTIVIWPIVTLVSFLSFAVTRINDCPACCTCEDVRKELNLRCWCIPATVPNNTIHFVLNEAEESDNTLTFSHPTWASVKSLNLRVHTQRSKWSLNNETFLGVPDLEVLHISNFGLENIPVGTFRPLQRLKVLDLSRNPYLQLDGISTTIGDLKNTSLNLLNLSKTNNYADGFRAVVVGASFFKLLNDIQLKVLDMSWTGRFYIDRSGFWKIQLTRYSYLEVLNISHSVLVVSMTGGIGTGYDYWFPALKHLVFEGVKMTYPIENIRSKCLVEFEMYSYDRHCANSSRQQPVLLPPLLETISFDNSLFAEGTCAEQTLRDTVCIGGENKLKAISLKNVGITGWNMAILLNGLETLDLRHNRMIVITRRSLQYIPNLKRLLAGSNLLGKEQTSETLKNLLVYSHNLEEIDLSANILSFIPTNLFIHNRKLRNIDISNNNLAALSLELRHLINLKTLDVSRNFIVSLSEFSFRDIKVLSSVIHHPFINISSNRLICSCNSEMYITSLHAISTSLISFETYMCQYKGNKVKLRLTEPAMLRHDCVIESLVIALPVSSTVILLAVGSVVLYWKRIYFIKLYVVFRFWRYRKKLVNEKKRVFLAYSHHDKNVVLGDLYWTLESKLQTLLGTNDDVLYINDKHFALPGLIDEEILTAVSSCKCTLAIISRRFLKSSWTHLEVSYSWVRKRPIILVFLEDIPERELHGILKYLYNKNVRLVWPRENGTHNEITFWITLLDGLVKILDPEKDETHTTESLLTSQRFEYNSLCTTV